MTPSSKERCHACGESSAFADEQSVLRRAVAYFDWVPCGHFQTEQPDWLECAYKRAINDVCTGIMMRAAYADARARGDAHFMRCTLARSLRATFALAVLAAGTVALAELVTCRWTRGQVEVTLIVVLVFGVWTVLEATGNALAMFLNGCGIIRPQVVSILVFCALATPLKCHLAGTAGVSRVFTASIGAFLIAVPLLYSTLFRSTTLAALDAASRNRLEEAGR